eukprot:m.847096 g.847096  ORF g.847096 m.847096 type:complete len:348 (+) comp23480_c0_seq5:129-1172(+)
MDSPTELTASLIENEGIEHDHEDCVRPSTSERRRNGNPLQLVTLAVAVLGAILAIVAIARVNSNHPSSTTSTAATSAQPSGAQGAFAVQPSTGVARMLHEESQNLLTSHPFCSAGTTKTWQTCMAMVSTAKKISAASAVHDAVAMAGLVSNNTFGDQVNVSVFMHDGNNTINAVDSLLRSALRGRGPIYRYILANLKTCQANLSTSCFTCIPVPNTTGCLPILHMFTGIASGNDPESDAKFTYTLPNFFCPEGLSCDDADSHGLRRGRSSGFSGFIQGLKHLLGIKYTAVVGKPHRRTIKRSIHDIASGLCAASYANSLESQDDDQPPSQYDPATPPAAPADPYLHR